MLLKRTVFLYSKLMNIGGKELVNFQGIKKASFSDACVFRYSFFKLRRQNLLYKICF